METVTPNSNTGINGFSFPLRWLHMGTRRGEQVLIPNPLELKESCANLLGMALCSFFSRCGEGNLAKELGITACIFWCACGECFAVERFCGELECNNQSLRFRAYCANDGLVQFSWGKGETGRCEAGCHRITCAVLSKADPKGEWKA